MARSIEHIRKIKREHMARKRAANLEAARAYARLDHSRNRDARTAKMREYYGKRFFWGRAMKLRGINRATTRDLSRLWYDQRGLCALTGRRLDRLAQVDHITAKACGGDDSVGNLRWVCAALNYAKRDMTDEKLITLCADVSAWIGKRIEKVHTL